jgi:drug/metabolite transporter (DMT)-like permease
MKTDSISNNRVTYILLAVIILIWGANWPIMKIGLNYMPPLWFAFSRSALGSMTLFVVLLITRQLRLPPRQDLSILFSYCLLFMVGAVALMHCSLLYVPAGRSAVLIYTTPLWVTPAAYFVFGEKLTPRKILGLIIGLGGLAVLFNPVGFQWGDRMTLIGNLMPVGGAILWSIAILHVRAHSWKASPLLLAFWQMSLATLILGLLALWLSDFKVISWTGNLMATLAYNGPLASGLCLWAVLVVNRNLPATATAVGYQGVPVAGVLFSAAWAGESLTATLITSLVMIMAGIILVNFPDKGSRRV